MKKKEFQMLLIAQIILYIAAVAIFLIFLSVLGAITFSDSREYADYVSGYVIIGNMFVGMFAAIVASAILGLDIMIWLVAIVHTILLFTARKKDTSGKEKSQKLYLGICQCIDILIGNAFIAEALWSWQKNPVKYGFSIGGVILLSCSCLSIYFLYVSGRR